MALWPVTAAEAHYARLLYALFWLLLLFALPLAYLYAAHAETHGGVFGRPGGAIFRFLRARWRQARGYSETWVID